MFQQIQEFYKKIKASSICFKSFKICILYLCFGAIVTYFTKIFGNAISCNGTKDLNEKSIEDHCFMYPMSQLSEKFKKFALCSLSETDQDIHYYQFIHLLCLLCAGLLSVPLLLLQNFEHFLTEILQNGISKKCLESFKTKSHKFRSHFLQFFGILAGELLLLLIVFGSLDYVMNHNFFGLGFAVLKHIITKNTLQNPVCSVFPISVSCLFTYLDNTGTLSENTYLCTLNNQFFNGVYFVCLWCFFIYLLMVTIGSFIFWMTLLFKPNMRARAIKAVSSFDSNLYFKLTFICRRIGMPKFFMLFMIMSQSNEDFNDALISGLYLDLSRSWLCQN